MSSDCVLLTIVNSEYFVVEIFRIAWLMQKLNTRKNETYYAHYQR